MSEENNLHNQHCYIHEKYLQENFYWNFYIILQVYTKKIMQKLYI